ncbi:MAG: EAL domain-containing protein [Gammaproteobacteria bacterium]|nr:EAL domain-containing protein [Gammaproteobacteria bacterium]
MGLVSQHRSFRLALPLTILVLYTLAMAPWLLVTLEQHRGDVLARGRAELVTEGHRLEQLVLGLDDRAPATLERYLELRPGDSRLINSAFLGPDGGFVASNSSQWPDTPLNSIGAPVDKILENRQSAKKMEIWASRNNTLLHGLFPIDIPHQPEYLSGSVYVEYDLAAAYDEVTSDLFREAGLLWVLMALATLTGGFLMYQRAQGKLTTSQRQYQTLAELAPVGIFRTDLEGNCIFVNDRWRDITGVISPERMVGGWINAVYPDDRDRVEEEWHQAIENQEVFECKTRLSSSKTAADWVIVRAAPEQDGTGELTGYVGTLTELGSSEEIEDALQRTEHQLKDAQDHARLGYWSMDAQSQEAHWSEQLYRMTGLDMSCSAGPKSLSDMLDPRDRDKVLFSINRALCEGVGHHMEYRIHKVDTQEERWIECSARPVLGEDGQVLRLQGIAQDVTERKRVEVELERALLRADLYLEVVGVMLLGLDHNGRVTLLNNRGCEILGCRQEDVLGLDWVEEFVPEPEREQVRLLFLGLKNEEQELIKYVENTIITRRGEHRRIAWHNVRLKEADGLVSGILSSGEDVTSQRQTEESLRLAASVFDNTHDGVLITDAAGKILNVNASFTRMTGYPREQVLGRNPSMFKSGKHDWVFYREMWRALEENGFWEGEIINRRSDGEPLYETLAISTVYNEHGEVTQYVGVFSDISHFKEHQEHLAWQARHDILTGLPNRLLLAERITSAFELAKRRKQLVAICILDLDRFKPINDTYGHETGDQLLIEVARRLSLAVRSIDTVARLGGDEFVLVLAGCNSVTEVEEILTRVQSQLRLPFSVAEHSFRVSSSIGVAIYPVNGKDADNLLRNADYAMYGVKQSGKDSYRFFDQLEERQAKSHRQLMNELRGALKSDELCLLYQPKVDVHLGRVTGVEALVRWQHPRYGFLLPERFLPQIEMTHLAIETDQWVVSNVIRQMQAWISEGLDVSVNINLGALALLEPAFFQWFGTTLQNAPEIDPSRLELEISENVAFSDLELVNETIESYRELGVHFALGKFGTGSSSLTFLKKLPVQVVKIDQMFVSEMLQDSEYLAIVEGVMGLARAFNRSVVAQGVESAEHGRLLLGMGCSKMQGDGIAKPMTAVRFKEWITGFSMEPTWQEIESEVFSRDLSLLSADLFHQKWVERILASLGQPNKKPNDQLWLGDNECNFGRWLNSSGLAAWDHLEEVKVVEKLHQRLHQCAYSLLEQAMTHHGGTQGEIEQLQELQGEFSSALQNLHGVCPSQGGRGGIPVSDSRTPV